MNLKTFLQAASRNIQRLGTNAKDIDQAAFMFAATDKPILLLGVGKSAFIAQKMVASLRSISKSAVFLDPTEVLHGDAGQVVLESVVVMISKSGNSSELKAVLPFLKTQQCEIVAITNQHTSPLGKEANLVLLTHIEEEGDKDNLLPLISCEMALVLCDYLVAKVAHLTELSAAHFQRNHPGGQLGLNLSVSLRQIPAWGKRRHYVNAETPLLETILAISESRTGMVCVVNDEHALLGIVTDGDTRRAWISGRAISTLTAKEVMCFDPVVVCPDWTVKQALDAMEFGKFPVFAAPVVNEGRICQGVVVLHDLISLDANNLQGTRDSV